MWLCWSWVMCFVRRHHTDIALRAKKLDVKVEVIQNASVMGAVGKCGLQLYSYGQCVSLPFWTEQWRPTSWYEKIAFNRSGNLHTLCLLDIKVKEPDYAHLAETGRTRYLPPRFMTINQAVEQLLSAEAEHGQGVCGPDARAVGLASWARPTSASSPGRWRSCGPSTSARRCTASCSARRPCTTSRRSTWRSSRWHNLW